MCYSKYTAEQFQADTVSASLRELWRSADLPSLPSSVTVVLSSSARQTRSPCTFLNYIAFVERTKVTTVNHAVKNLGTTFAFTLTL